MMIEGSSLINGTLTLAVSAMGLAQNLSCD